MFPLDGLDASPSCDLPSATLTTQEIRIWLPKVIESLLANPAKHSISLSREPNLKLLVVDSSATDHLIPDVEAFYRYKRILGFTFIWVTIFHFQCLAMERPSSRWMENVLLFETLCTCRVTAIHYTVSELT